MGLCNDMSSYVSMMESGEDANPRPVRRVPVLGIVDILSYCEPSVREDMPYT